MSTRARIVHIVGEEDAYEVLCETPTTLVLINLAARLQRQVASIEGKLAGIRAEITRLHRRDAREKNGDLLDGL